MIDKLSGGPAFSDEDLMAYADNALPLPQANAIRIAAAADSALARKIEMFRQSRAALRAAFEPVLAEPVPDRLLALFDRDALAAGNVTPSPAPSPIAKPQRRTRALPMALAASLLLAVLVSVLHRPPVVQTSAALDALVVAALETRASGVPLADEAAVPREVMPLSTVLAGDGRYCRDYETTTLAAGQTPASTRGRACRSEGGWVGEDVAAVRPDAPVDQYRPASGGAAATDGQRLDPDAEAALIARGWKR